MSPLLKRERSSQGVSKMSGGGVVVGGVAGRGAEHEMRIKLRLRKETKTLFMN
jgi:hypothetical protein